MTCLIEVLTNPLPPPRRGEINHNGPARERGLKAALTVVSYCLIDVS